MSNLCWYSNKHMRKSDLRGWYVYTWQ